MLGMLALICAPALSFFSGYAGFVTLGAGAALCHFATRSNS